MCYRKLWFGVAISLATAGVFSAGGAMKANRWEPAIRTFETADAENPPKLGGVVFVGSSSIRFWDLKKSFPRLDAINRGFGGSHVADAVHFADRVVIKYKPRLVVLYAGDNDIAAGKSPQRVSKDFQTFVKKMHAALPETRVVFICIKPSIRRWKLVDRMRQANKLIADVCAKDNRLTYVDIDKPMIGPDGQPRQELFVKDGLHLSQKGYTLWAKLLIPHVPPKDAAR